MVDSGFLKNILFLDIETVSSVRDFKDLPERFQKEWERKASFLNKEELSLDEFYQKRAAIYAEFGKIIVIGIGFLHVDSKGKLNARITSLQSDDERDLLQQFNNVVQKFDQDNVILCAHNGKEFDFPYIGRRMVMQNVPLPECLKMSGKKPWEVQHLDTMEMWKFGDRKNYTSLELITACLGIESSKSDLDGSMITQHYYMNKGVDDISTYCKRDVLNVIQVYLRLNEHPILEKKDITFI